MNKDVYLNRFDKLEFDLFLKDHGIKFDKVDDSFKILYEGKKLPSIRYNELDDCIDVFYQSKYNSFGRVSYQLDYVNFIHFYKCKELDEFFYQFNVASNYVRFVLSFFDLNPTLLKKAISKKSKKFKLRLSLKEKCAKLLLNGKG